ncbi:MAG: aminopeptidase [Candidatus Thermoplasmatota archaeon]|nr:aminopeptidase [Candidatus Thermoplasmatota archaeon]
MPARKSPKIPVENRLARQVLVESLRVRRGENVAIETWSHTLPHATAFVYEARKSGARTILLLGDEETYWKSVEDLPAKTLGEVGNHEWGLLSKTNAYVFFMGPADRSRLRSLGGKAFEALTAYNHEWYERAKKARLRGARVYLSMATDAAARRFKVDGKAWRKELLEASLVDTADMVREGRKVAQALRRGKRITLEHANGTHLELRLKGRTPEVQDGVVDPEDVAAGRTMIPIPSGVVGVAVDESFAEGTVVANRTSFLQSERAEGGKWTFRDGRLVEYSYRKGGDAFEVPYKAAPKGRDLPAFLSVGLNPRLSQTPQMEDQERGVVGVAVGGNKFQGGSNDCPFLSWLAVGGCDLKIDGRTLLRKGTLV